MKRQILKTSIVWSALALAACVIPTNPPVQPGPAPTPIVTPPQPMASLAVIVKDQAGVAVQRAQVQIVGQTVESTNADGYTVSTVPLGRYDVIVTASCCERVITAVTLTQNQDVTVTIVRPAPPMISGGESGPVTSKDAVFRNADGSIRKWNGNTDFLLFLRFLNGEDIGPVLDQRIAAGVRTFRVLGMVDSFAHFYPQERDNYLGQLSGFRTLMNSRGVRIEFVVFADAQVIMPSNDVQEAHLERVFQALSQDYTGPDGRGPPVVFTNFIEIANEPFKNIPGGGARAYELGRKIYGRSPNVLVASGDYDIPFNVETFDHLDYVTVHDERKPEWPRTPRGHAEIRDGFAWKRGDVETGVVFQGVRVPVVGDEPTGVAEESRGDSRTDNCEDVGYYAATAALMSGNATYHSDDGIQSVLWRPRQAACAAVFFDVMRFIPGEAQLSGYMRGDRRGGAAVGDMPVVHFDLDQDGRFFNDDGSPCDDCHPAREVRALRTFAKWAGEFVYVDAIRTTVDHLVPRDGFVVDVELRKGIGRLRRVSPIESFFRFFFPVFNALR